jgi:acetate kinase
LPERFIKEYDIQRFGFHGLAHRYMIQRYCTLHPDPTHHRIISFQLGHGCSVTATQDGKPVDTSMGFTPLDELESKLQHSSGLLGISKSSADMRELLDIQSSNEDARLAIEMFCYRARKYLGVYMAILNGVDVVFFCGGIGEHSPEIRQRICADMIWCGLQLDETRNKLAANGLVNGTEILISADSSKVRVYVIAVDEELVIAEDAKKEFADYKSGVIHVVFPDQKHLRKAC